MREIRVCRQSARKKYVERTLRAACQRAAAEKARAQVANERCHKRVEASTPSRAPHLGAQPSVATLAFAFTTCASLAPHHDHELIEVDLAVVVPVDLFHDLVDVAV